MAINHSIVINKVPGVYRDVRNRVDHMLRKLVDGGSPMEVPDNLARAWQSGDPIGIASCCIVLKAMELAAPEIRDRAANLEVNTFLRKASELAKKI